MKTSRIAAIGAATTIAVVALLLAYPAMATPSGNADGYPLTGTALAAAGGSQSSILPSPTALTVGQTLTFASTSGQYRVVGGSGETGTASGTLSLTVTGVYKGGYSLSVASGTISLNGTTFTVSSGSAEMGPYQAHLVGQGDLGATTPGSFLFAAGAHANFQGKIYNTLRFDVQADGAEYGVLLLVTVTVS